MHDDAWLIVSRDGANALQIAVDKSTGAMFTRGATGLGASPVFSPWRRVALHNDVAVPLAGGKSSADLGNVGGVRIMWGSGRVFPGSAADIVRPGWWRYYRIYVTAIGSSNIFGIGEIEVRGSSGGADMTNTGTRVAGTNGVRLLQLVDNKWAVENDCYEAFAAAAPYFVSADLGTYTAEQAVYAAELVIYPHVINPASKSPKDFKVQGSLDNATWTDIKTFTGVTGWTAGTPKIFSLT